ncbi:putative membrane protein [Morus notabilis]|uniref:Putative membrane protein n=1 Tax=Morus notabilis TaxID=981085 RepID=W9SAF4_9ROSA|nr:putative membrane protein [Morus notabilis]
MNISALLTSAGINIAVCLILISLYSILRKQPSNVTVYFGRRIASGRSRRTDPFCFERFVPSPSWIVRAWVTTEEDLLAIGGMDAVVFLRSLICSRISICWFCDFSPFFCFVSLCLLPYSIRIFAIAAIIGCFVVLPVNYYGQKRQYQEFPLESLEVFTILNVQEGSKWLWTHCLTLYILTCSACVLLYFEYRSIAKMRLAHITESPPNPSHFTVLVRAIPWSAEDTYSNSVKKFFMKYHESSYLFHQMVHRAGTIQKLMSDAEKMYMVLKAASVERNCTPGLMQCGPCTDHTNSFKVLSSELETVKEERADFVDMDLVGRKKECAAAFVFFKTRYAAVVAAQVLQSANPMLWVTDSAPEPHDVYWSNLWIPYGQLWIRKIATLMAAIAFMLVFLIPVTFVQGLTQLEQLQQTFPFLKGILKKKFVSQLATGYLPSVILILFLYTVPPTMMLFSVVEGSISRSGRKKSACCKILYFTIWNVFFVNVFTGSVIRQLRVFSSVKDIPAQLANAVPAQASFFLTYVLSSGWASLACEVMQLFPLLCNLIKRVILRIKSDSPDAALSFPYHTEIPRLLLFGFLGFTCSILVPLILPFLLVYFVLAYFVYRNQILNVYVSKYESGGLFWPIVHNTTIFSLVFMQIIALGVFGLRRSPVSSGFTIPLVICTLLFNEYCRQRFHPIFKNHAAEVLIDMDRRDEESGKMEEIYQQLHSAYYQFTLTPHDLFKSGSSSNHEGGDSVRDPENVKPGEEHSQVNGSIKIV